MMSKKKKKIRSSQYQNIRDATVSSCAFLYVVVEAIRSVSTTGVDQPSRAEGNGAPFLPIMLCALLACADLAVTDVAWRLELRELSRQNFGRGSNRDVVEAFLLFAAS